MTVVAEDDLPYYWKDSDKCDVNMYILIVH